jgi:Big-like domain-containing protein
VEARKLALLLVGLPLWFTAACGGDNLTLPSEGEPAAITVKNGDDQQARVNSPLPLPLEVEVTDTRARPVAGATVQFTFDNPSGEVVSPQQIPTNTEGKATVSVTLGTRVGAVTGHASVVVPEGTVPVTTTFSATALSDDANGIAQISGSGQSGAVGTTLLNALVVQVTDKFGNPIPQIEVQWSIPDGGGSVSETSTQTDAQGMTSVFRTLGSTAGEWTTLASAGGAAGSPGALAGSPVIFTHTATAGNASRVEIVDGNNQDGAPNTELPKDLVVRVLDADGNPIVNRAVSWVVGAGGGTANPETSFTDGQGQARTRWKLGPSAGTNTLSAVVSGVGRASFTATAGSSASHTTITSDQPDPSVVGQTVHVEFSVTGDGGTPTGNVTVTVNGGSESCTGTVASGACDIVLNNPGNRELTATYAGDSRFSGSLDHNSHRVEQAQPQNSPPTAQDDGPYTTNEDTPLHISADGPQGWRANDTDPDGDPLTPELVADATNGHVTVNADGSFDYTPNSNFSGDDSFSYRVNDGRGGLSNTATIRISVTPVNDAPVAAPDPYSTPAGQPLSVDAPGVLGNDTDPDGDNLTAELVTQPTNGLVTLNQDGSFTYFPGAAASGTQETFTYNASDGTLTSSATVTITIQ